MFSWLAGLCPYGVRSIWVVTEFCINFFRLNTMIRCAYIREKKTLPARGAIREADPAQRTRLALGFPARAHGARELPADEPRAGDPDEEDDGEVGRRVRAASHHGLSAGEQAGGAAGRERVRHRDHEVVSDK